MNTYNEKRDRLTDVLVLVMSVTIIVVLVKFMMRDSEPPTATLYREQYEHIVDGLHDDVAAYQDTVAMLRQLLAACRSLK